MKSFPQALATCIAAVLVFEATRVTAGTEMEAGTDKKVVAPPEKQMPVGMLTLGGKISNDVSSGYLDGIMPLWNPGDFFFFLNTRTNLDTDDQMVGSYGLGTRYLVPDHDVILGINSFYDSIHSRNGNDFDELGLGAEVLTKWVDARFNYYLPDSDRYEISRHSEHSFNSEVGPVFPNQVAPGRILLQQQKFTRDERKTTRRYEYAHEGWNAEVGFLVPGLEKYMELRVFAGAYSYDNLSGFKGRVEARPLPGIIANVEYWDDAQLMGGHWTGELGVSVPFSIFNLAKGRNPFEGISDSFRPRQREFRERLSDMIIRSHHVMTDETPVTTTTTNTGVSTSTNGVILLKPPVKKLPPSTGTTTTETVETVETVAR